MLTADNFLRFADKISDEDLQEYVNNLKRRKEQDYMNQTWGHSFMRTKNYGKYLQFGYGFSKNQQVEVGDYLIAEAESGKIGKFLILHIRYEQNPRDMFWAYMVCDGYKE